MGILLLLMALLMTQSVAFGFSKNMLRMFFDCDLGGVRGDMVMDVDVIQDTGVTWGPGAQPDIGAVIGTGSSTTYVSGEIKTQSGGRFVFTGSAGYADFTNLGNHSRFRVKMQLDPRDNRKMWLVSDPTHPATQGQFAFPCILKGVQPFTKEFNPSW